MASTSQSRNVIVGAGRLFTAPVETDLPADIADDSNLQSYIDDANWTELGFTQEGVEVSYQPDYGEVEVDQLGDAVTLFRQKTTVMMSTNLVEATLENLLVAWGYPDTQVSNGVFSIGIAEERPVERALVVVGRGTDKLFPAAGNASGNDEVRRQERIYHAQRVISVEGSNHSMRRTEATVFPVSFRLLADARTPGAEYGSITERLIEAAPASV